jgi:hypothetical protein
MAELAGVQPQAGKPGLVDPGEHVTGHRVAQHGAEQRVAVDQERGLQDTNPRVSQARAPIQPRSNRPSFTSAAVAGSRLSASVTSQRMRMFIWPAESWCTCRAKWVMS